MDPWFYGVAFLYGLCFGSFLNVCIYRLPEEGDTQRRSLLSRSRCPHCQEPIRFYDNIPLFSWLFLRGRCRQCHEPISIRYFLVELATGFLFLACLWRFGLSWAFLWNACFLGMILVLMLIDIDHRILPNVITLPGMAAGLMLSPIQSLEFFEDKITSAVAFFIAPPGHEEAVIALSGSIFGLVVGGGLLWLVAELYFRFRRIEGLGFGDVKMMAMVGATLGWQYALLTIFLGSILGSLVGLAWMKITGRDSSYQLPFGTFLGLGAAMAVLFGPQILDWYLQLY